MLVAGEEVKVIYIDHFLGFAYSEWALSRGENRCSVTSSTSEKNMFINLFKGLRCRGVECGEEKHFVISLIVTIHELNVREHAHVGRLHAGGRNKRSNSDRSSL